MTKIKICGLRRKEDALLAASLGADFLGFIFAAESPRYLAPMFAAEVIETVRGRSIASKFVGVFRNEKPANVRAIARGVGLDFVQLQGSETEDDIREIGLPAIKALHVGLSVPDTNRHPGATWLLFDTRDPRLAGGTGRTFDWSLLAARHCSNCGPTLRRSLRARRSRRSARRPEEAAGASNPGAPGANQPLRGCRARR